MPNLGPLEVVILLFMIGFVAAIIALVVALSRR
jgi:hypothetical protein